MIRYIGFTPDLDPTTPGAILAAENLIPTTKGMAAAPTPIPTGVAASSNTVHSLAMTELLDGTRRTFLGSDTHLEEIVSGVITDRSGKTYSVPSGDRWTFAQFGDYTIAANKGDVLQFSSTAAFADIAGSPQAEHVAVSEGFIMVANTSTDSDEWHCSGFQDYADWTPSISTQCTKGRLISGGEITGLKALGSGFVAFKNRAMYLASYIGSPAVWQWDEVVGDIGCPTGHAAIDIGDKIAFMSERDFYVFDGATVTSIGEGMREWFFNDIAKDKLQRTQATYNPSASTVTWHYCSTQAPDDNPDKAVVFNTVSGKWGVYTETVQAAGYYFHEGVLYDNIGNLYNLYDDFPNVTYDVNYWGYIGTTFGVVGTNNQVKVMAGQAGNSSITMNTVGDDEAFTTITQVRPRFLIAPDSSTLDYSYDDTYGDIFTSKLSATLNNGKYDVLHSSRWHRVKLNFSGNMEIVGADIKLTPDGIQ